MRTAYDAILRDLERGELVAGSRISETALAESLGISRTPVREAIRKLESEGLIEQFPRYGTFIRTPTAREVHELYEERDALERYAARTAAERGAADAIAAVADCCERMAAIVGDCDAGGLRTTSAAGRRHQALDLAFHDAIATASGNRRIHGTLFASGLMARIFAEKYQHERLIPLAELEQALRDHRAIVAALSRRDGARAEALVGEHNRHGLADSLSRADHGGRDDAGHPGRYR